MQCDLLLLNGKVLTDNSFKKAVAIKGNKIVFVGDNQEAKNFIAKKTIDLKGKLVLPSFNDAHTHFVFFAINQKRLNLQETKSISEVLEKIKNFKTKEKFIVGYNWDEENWKEKRIITKDELDSLKIKMPIVLIRVDVHSLVANSIALKMAKVKSKNGILKEKKMEKVLEIIKPNQKEVKQCLKNAIKIAHKNGITSIQDMVGLNEINLYKKFYKNGELKLRVNLIFRGGINNFIKNKLYKFENNEYLRIKTIKLFADGSIGSHTAYLSFPYKDKKSFGKLFYREKQLTKLFKKIDKRNLQIAIHSIGNKATEVVLNAFEKINTKNKRHRIEHLEFFNKKQVKKIKKLNLIASMQPNFIGMFSKLYNKRLGKKFNNRINLLLKNRIKICFGSDCMPFSPLYGIHSAINSKKEQRISLKDAIKCYTLNSAFAEFGENIKGKIGVGKIADLVVLNEDIFKVRNIKDIKVEMTIFDGKVVYLR